MHWNPIKVVLPSPVVSSMRLRSHLYEKCFLPQSGGCKNDIVLNGRKAILMLGHSNLYSSLCFDMSKVSRILKSTFFPLWHCLYHSSYVNKPLSENCLFHPSFMVAFLVDLDSTSYSLSEPSHFHSD